MPIAIAGDDTTGLRVAEVETNSRALRVTNKPLDFGSFGSYQASATSGTMAAGLAANAPIFSFRWGINTGLALIRRISMSAVATGTGFSAGSASFGMVFARSFSASDSGGTAIFPSTGTAGMVNFYKRRTGMNESAVADIRISNTAALTVGTRTLDTNALSRVVSGVAAVAWLQILPWTELWATEFAGEWPLVLARDEGFIIQATVPATGTWTFTVVVEWTEVPYF